MPSSLLALVLASVLLTSCTRDRPTPDPTPAAEVAVVNVETAATDVSTTDAISGTQASAEVLGTSVTSGTVETPSDALTITLSLTLPDELVAAPGEEGDAAATPTPAVNNTFSYIVEVGDSIGTVAEKFGTDITTIRELNYLRGDDILVGQEIRVPSAPGISQEGLPTPTPPPFEYTVQQGDALGSIAQEFGVDQTTLLNANALADPNNLQPGQTLVIPGVANTGSAAANDASSGEEASEAQSDAAPAGAQATHVVQAGEQLAQIAQLYGVSAAEIALVNGLQNANIIRPGQELIIPGVTQREAELATQETYTVQPGDSLGAIALRFSVTAQQIIEANDIVNPNIVNPGEVLVIPQP